MHWLLSQNSHNYRPEIYLETVSDNLIGELPTERLERIPDKSHRSIEVADTLQGDQVPVILSYLPEIGQRAAFTRIIEQTIPALDKVPETATDFAKWQEQWHALAEDMKRLPKDAREYIAMQMFLFPNIQTFFTAASKPNHPHHKFYKSTIEPIFDDKNYQEPEPQGPTTRPRRTLPITTRARRTIRRLEQDPDSESNWLALTELINEAGITFGEDSPQCIAQITNIARQIIMSDLGFESTPTEPIFWQRIANNSGISPTLLSSFLTIIGIEIEPQQLQKQATVHHFSPKDLEALQSYLNED